MRYLSFAALGFAAVCASAPLARAVDFQFDGQHIDVPYITGSGASSAMLVLDFGPTAIYQFGYQWDGTRTSVQMLDDIAAAGGVNVTSSFTGTPDEFVTSITYNGQGLVDSGTSQFGDYPTNWWEYFVSRNPGNWDFADLGAGSNPLVSGDWNLWAWQTDPSGLNVPGPIPEPASLALLAFGGLALLKRSARTSRLGV
jgi:hypothetical protein